jgi:signal transduction histidine kinase
MDDKFLEHILIISRKMAETRMLSPLLNYVIEEAMQICGAERGYVVLLQDDGGLDFPVKKDRDGNVLANPQDQISTSVLKEVVTTGQPIILKNAVDDPRFGVAESVVVLGLRSIMCVPLISRGDVTGAIYVENRAIRNRFKQDDLALLTLFANQAAVAIDNAALNEELEARVVERTKELEAARNTLEKSWTEAIEANRLRTVWLSQIAHDLRAPLGIVQGSLSLMRDGTLGPVTEEQLEWINKSIKSLGHTASLTEQILYLSRIEEGRLALNLDNTDLNRLCRNTYDIARGMPWTAEVAFKLDIPAELPWIEVDAVRIQQVLINLISNARKFTSSGSVMLTAKSEDNSVKLSVIDTGDGIPPQDMEHIFDRFKTSKKKDSRKGAGLGLAICRDLVMLHHGTIQVESTPGSGSTFTVTLPLEQPLQEPAPPL